MSHERITIRRRAGRRAAAGTTLAAALLGLLAALVLLAACETPWLRVTVLPAATPGPSPTPPPTLCAHARVSGKACAPGVDVYLSSCCPEWAGITTAGAGGAFAFESLTAGTYTVSAGLRSRRIILRQCDSQVSTDLCSGPVP